MLVLIRYITIFVLHNNEGPSKALWQDWHYGTAGKPIACGAGIPRGHQLSPSCSNSYPAPCYVPGKQ